MEEQNNLKCIIVDNDATARATLKRYIEQVDYLQLQGEAESATQGRSLLKETDVDLLFIDVNIPDLNGLEFVKSIETKPMVVFTTTTPEYAAESFRVNAVDYLLKPITLEAFLGAANRAYAYAETSRRSTSVPNTTIPEERDVNGFFVKADYKTVRIDYRDIVYAESMSEYMRIHLEGISRPIITLLTMHRLEEILPSDRFLRVHRSYIVNMEKVSEVSRLRIVFGKDTYIPVGEQYKDKFMQFIGRYFVGKE